ncbi:exopolygalacturonase-like [Apium graveolens]|uniref:exopolygalacturonase-like n=1 Tax=Apium graveolens TaxID=4045 RepID=UPI003D796A5E
MAIPVVTAFQLIFVLISYCAAQDGSSNAKIYDVMKYGAVPNGKDDNSKQFWRAWEDACQWNGKGVMLIPKGIYKLYPVKFTGPCKGSTAVRIVGNLKASTDITVNPWINFQSVHRLIVEGNGTVDGEGASVWSRYGCKHNQTAHCQPLPISIGFNFVTNSKIRDLNMLNSKGVHMKVFSSQKVMITGVKITAPEDSPNTDGINISESRDIKVHECNIATGDDCVSMLNGNENVEIFHVACGPGHGISVGSLGESSAGKNMSMVKGLHVKNCSFSGTENGLRIKTWAPSEPGLVSDFVYENVEMENANNPIIVDQHYCPDEHCDKNPQSSIQIKNVTFNNIWGQSSTQIAVNIQCSSKVPCLQFKLQDINLDYNGRGVAKSECSNVYGQAYGREQPPGCL